MDFDDFLINQAEHDLTTSTSTAVPLAGIDSIFEAHVLEGNPDPLLSDEFWRHLQGTGPSRANFSTETFDSGLLRNDLATSNLGNSNAGQLVHAEQFSAWSEPGPIAETPNADQLPIELFIAPPLVSPVSHNDLTLPDWTVSQISEIVDESSPQAMFPELESQPSMSTFTLRPDEVSPWDHAADATIDPQLLLG
jgi:hypothetical protein